MFSPRNIQLHQELLAMAEEKTAGLNAGHLKPLLAAAAGGAAVGIPLHMIEQARAEEERKRTRNHAFGAGVAAGVVSPKLIRHVFDIAENRGLMAPPTVPEIYG